MDGSGNAYVTGDTNSSDFPKVNAKYPNLWGSSDAFVFKLSSNGQSVIYSTYLGGSRWDGGNGIAVDGSGIAYVTGNTQSTDFPTMNAKYPNLWGSSDAYVFKLSSNGQSVIYSTYLGGSGEDGGNGIAVDGSGIAYVTGSTGSTDFPTVNAKYPNLWGSGDAFIFKLSSNGQSVIYSTYLGGSDWDGGYSVAVDGSGNAYMTGSTGSTDFPAVNAKYPNLWGSSDAFVFKLSSNGQSVIYSTYLGGSSGLEGSSDIAVDGSGNAYVTGWTYSTDFPVVNAIYSTIEGVFPDAYVFTLSSNGQSVIYSTYLGGSGEDGGNGIAVDESGNAYVTGSTGSSDFPKVNAKYPSLWGGGDAFIAKLAPGNPEPESASLKLDIRDGRGFLIGSEISYDGLVLGKLQGQSMIGAATDGEARLLLRARTNHPGSVTFSIPTGDGELMHYQDRENPSDSVTVDTVSVGTEHMAFAIYRAPEQFPRSSADESKATRKTTLTVSLNPSDGSTPPTPLTPDLKLERPPVVLIHGLLSSSDTWQTFTETLADRLDINNSETHIFYGDYRHNNTAHFSTNKKVVQAAVIQARNAYLKRGIAVVQADVIGHSMGGILSRIWAGNSGYHQDKYYGAGDFNKLITVDSPHTGSRWADLGWTAWNNFLVRGSLEKLLGSPVDIGAIEDLQTASNALVDMNLQSTDVPGHVIVGDYEPTSDDLVDLACLASKAVSYPKLVAFCKAWKVFKWAGLNTSVSFNFPSGSDLVVGVDSQRDGFAQGSSQVSVFDHVHMEFEDRPSALETEVVVDTVVELLNASSEDGDFGQFNNGFLASSAAKAQAMRKQIVLPTVTVAAAGIGLAITSPADGATVMPGQILSVIVQPDAGVDLQALMLTYRGELQELDATPWEFTVEIPEDVVGPFALTVAGRDSSDTYYQADITLNVVPAVALQTLSVTPIDTLLTESGLTESLVVEGIYADAARRDLTGSVTGTTYQSSDDTVVTVDADGRMQAQGNGSATVTVQNGSVNAVVNVTVQAETDLALSQTDSPDPVGAGDEINYTLTVDNLGDQAATDVQLTDTLPEGASFINATGSSWSCAEASGEVLCEYARLEAGASASVTVRAAAPAACGVMTNRASVQAASEDGYVDDNVSTTTTSIHNTTDLQLTSSANPAPVGESVTFTSNVQYGANPTGTVAFTADGNPIAGCSAVSVSAGQAQCTTASLIAGNHNIQANYSGDGCHSASNSSLTQTVSAQHTVIITKTGNGTVTSEPDGIGCGSSCVAEFANNTSVTLTASPSAGWAFEGWGGVCIGTGTCVLTMDTDHFIEAIFASTEVMAERIGVKRGSQWYFDRNGNGVWNAGDSSATFGLASDQPVVGDWNGDGKTKIGVKRGTKWYLDYNGSGTWNNGDRVYTFGLASDQPVVGDWNGDGKTSIGVKRGTKWYLDYNGSGTWNSGDRAYTFGLASDQPVAGDWNGDGKTEIGVKRGTKWYLDYNGSGTWNSGDRAYTFGLASDKPVAGQW